MDSKNGEGNPVQPDHAEVKRAGFLLWVLALTIALAFQGTRGLYETTEGRYAEVAREMIERGNYLEPTLNYRHHWTKPPLTYWAIAGGIKVVGPNEWGVRLYLVLSFFLTVLLVVHIGHTLWDKKTGIAAGLVYTSSFFPVYGLYSANADMLVTLWETAAVFCFLKAGLSAESNNRKWIVGMWLFFSLGFLTKGPPSILPLIPILVWKCTHKTEVRVFQPWGVLLFFVVGTGWYVYVSVRHPGLLQYFVGQEVIARMATDSFDLNPEWYGPFIIYLPFLIIGAGPWLYYLLKIIWGRRLVHLRPLRDLLVSDKGMFFLFLWFLLPLVIFFIAKSRLPLYVLPLYAPVALFVARGIRLISETRYPLGRIVLIACLSGMFSIGVKGLGAYLPHQKDMKALAKLCRSATDSHARFITYYKKPLYGLQFYLDGNLQRIGRTDKLWNDGTLQSFLAEKKSATHSEPYVFITSARRAPALAEFLKAKGFQFRQVNSENWSLCVVN